MGEVFAGRYELADPIGRGGVGAVWRAWDHRRRRYVAAKVLQQRDAHSLLRFVREQALRIDHPHVLAPASWAADDDQVLFTMDLVAGGSLVHLVGDYGPLPPAFVCTLTDQLLSGLAAVHAEGVVHRDIKPANLLLEATGTGRPRLRLSDFGIAMRLGEPRLTETNLVVGTPGYLAPEQLLGSEPDFPADLFAVGLVALYLLEGAKPDAKALIQYFVEHGTPGAPKGMPEPLWQVVATLLQPDPEARFRTATGARKALASAAELLPDPGPDDELIEIFDQLGPLPPGFGPDGPFKRASGVRTGPAPGAGTTEDAGSRANAEDPHSGLGGPGEGAREDGSGSAAGSMTADHDSSPGTHTGSMSETGSFRLPPPQDPSHPGLLPRPAPETADNPGEPGPEHQPRIPQHSPPVPRHSLRVPRRPAHDPTPPTHPLTPSPQWYAQPYDQPSAWHAASHGSAAPEQRVDTSTASYTARSPQVPTPEAPVSGPPHPAPPVRGRRARGAHGRRTGPPAGVAIPMLLLALACYAVGFWALTRV
ncbi:protein kinase [Streptomyces sp. NPDC015139]|uniref:serine/threonine-protein kinase n=1 Tax=Streptomyces sp. NPDC015139 TaxID=3364942 RepID=UPI0036FAFDC1